MTHEDTTIVLVSLRPGKLLSFMKLSSSLVLITQRKRAKREQLGAIVPGAYQPFLSSPSFSSRASSTCNRGKPFLLHQEEDLGKGSSAAASLPPLSRQHRPVV